jgi:hypothetical protein
MNSVPANRKLRTVLLALVHALLAAGFFVAIIVWNLPR